MPPDEVLGRAFHDGVSVLVHMRIDA